jgi:hypothetical protein
VLNGRATSGKVEEDDTAPVPSAGRRGQYDAPPPASTGSAPSGPGPWGRTRIPQTESPEPPPRPRASRPKTPAAPKPSRTPASRTDSIGTTIAKTATRTVTNVLVREILRGVLGSRVR